MMMRNVFAVFASQPSVGLTAPLPRYRSGAAAAADGYTGQASPVLSPQAVPHNTSTPSPVCHVFIYARPFPQWLDSLVARASD